MENFIFHNPTRLHFGAGVTANIGKSAKRIGTKALLVYGKSSIKTNGLYANITQQLEEQGIAYVDYAGIKPNPVVSDVNNASLLAINEQVDFIIAIGGGSVIDSAKIISLAMHYQGDAWDLISGKVKPTKATPLIAVLTLAATGTEMNPFAVIQNPDLKKKIGFGHPLAYPKESFLDPINTLTVSENQTINGIVDTIAHSLEAWFGAGDASLSDKFVISIIQEMIEIGPLLLGDLTNLDLRTRMMFASSFALNGITFLGRKSGDWGVHDIGHTLSMLYDLPHGQTLSIAYPAWLKTVKPEIESRGIELGKALFNCSDYDKTVILFEDFFSKIKTPTHLSDVNIKDDKINEVSDLMNVNKVSGSNILLNDTLREQIAKKMF